MTERDYLLKLDTEWNEAYPKGDVSALDHIIADDWICIDGVGLLISKTQLLDRVKSRAFLDPHKFDERTVRMFGDTAIVTGRLSGERRNNDGTFYLEQRYTRVYVKRNGRWQCVATQVTVAKETRIMPNDDAAYQNCDRSS